MSNRCDDTDGTDDGGQMKSDVAGLLKQMGADESCLRVADKTMENYHGTINTDTEFKTFGLTGMGPKLNSSMNTAWGGTNNSNKTFQKGCEDMIVSAFNTSVVNRTMTCQVQKHATTMTGKIQGGANITFEITDAEGCRAASFRNLSVSRIAIWC